MVVVVVVGMVVGLVVVVVVIVVVVLVLDRTVDVYGYIINDFEPFTFVATL